DPSPSAGFSRLASSVPPHRHRMAPALDALGDRLPAGTVEVAVNENGVVVGGLTLTSALQEADEYEEFGQHERAAAIRSAVHRRDIGAVLELFADGWVSDKRLSNDAAFEESQTEEFRSVRIAPITTRQPLRAKPRPLIRQLRARPRERRAA